MLSAWRELAEDQADHLAVDQGGPAAVARVDRRVDLDPQAASPVVVAGELDPRDDPLGDREARAPLGIAVDHDGVLDLGERLDRRQRRPLLEERLVVELEDRQVHPGLTASTVAFSFSLDCWLSTEELAGVEDHVGVGQDPLAGDDHPRAAGLPRALLGPGADDVG